MASINDFKILNLKCSKYYEQLESLIPLARPATNSIDKSRLGFYLFMIENLCGERQIENIIDSITDDSFNNVISGTSDDDWGVDAVYIDEDEKKISLFNFKYREKYNPNKKQSINEAIISTKYVNAIINEDLSNLRGKTKKLAEKIIERLNSNEVWKFTLYIVSNDTLEIPENDKDIEQLKKLYDLEVINIGLSQISQIMSIRPEPLNATFVIDGDAIMSFSEHAISSKKSYIARLRISEVVRITCDDKNHRENYNIEDLTLLSSSKLDYGVLFDNVRGFVIKSKYNSNIVSTLRNEPNKFFMYNNGITIVAKQIDSQPINANKKVKVHIGDFQILNGGQTLRTIHSFNNESDANISEYLSKGEILVRIFSASNDDGTINKIAEYTNSQNTISSVDLKSLSDLQIDIEKFLDEHDIIYSRKTGDTGISDKKNYKYKIGMERFGQILLALNGEPEKSSNHKQQIFDKYYEKLFGADKFDITAAPKIVENYFNIVQEYAKLSHLYTPMEQKYYYIVLLDSLDEQSIEEKIHFLEKSIREYKKTEQIPDARKMIQVTFREQIMTAYIFRDLVK